MKHVGRVNAVCGLLAALVLFSVREASAVTVSELADMRVATARPADFESYWAGERIRLSQEVPAEIRKTRVAELSTAAHDFYDVSFPTFSGKRVYGVMTVPKGEGPFPVRVTVPGAGPGSVQPSAPAGWIGLVLNVHGFPTARTDDEQQQRYKQWEQKIRAQYGVSNYMHAGLGVSREAYVFHDVILGMVRALEWLEGEAYVDKRRIVFFGSSQGGAFGFYLCALWGKFARAFLNVPAMADLLAYKEGKLPGGPDPVRGHSGVQRAVAEAHAPYFDTTAFAPMVRTPVRIVVGLTDRVCPWETSVAAFNALGSGDKRLYAVQDMGHEYGTPCSAELFAWLTCPCKPQDGDLTPVKADDRSAAYTIVFRK